MDHEKAAVAAVRLVESVRKAGVDRKIVARIRIHQLGCDRIEALRRLAVALALFRPDIARPAADRIGLEELEAAGVVLLPDLEFGLFLENPHEDRREFRHLLLLDQRRADRGRQLLRRLGRQWRGKIGRRGGSGRLAKALDRRQCRGKSRRQHRARSPPWRGSLPVPPESPTRGICSYLAIRNRWHSYGKTTNDWSWSLEGAG